MSCVPVPVNMSREEWVSLNLLGSTSSKSPVGVPLEQAGHDRSCLVPHIVWESKGVVKNTLIHEVYVFVVERWKTGHHFIQKHAQGPPIDSLIVSLAFEQLGSNVLWSTTEG